MLDRHPCIVFDLDDTLYLERDFVHSGFQVVGNLILGRFGIDSFYERAWSEFENGLRVEIFDKVIADCGLGDGSALIPELVEIYRHHTPRISLQPDAAQCLNRLQGRCVALITDGILETQRAKVSALNLQGLLKPLVFTSELGADSSKPSPLGFRAVESETSFTGSDCVYIADNPLKDFRGPRELGWRTIRVRRPQGLYRSHESGPDVDIEVTDLTECL